VLRNVLKQLAAKAGLRIMRLPKPLLDDPSKELVVDLEMVVLPYAIEAKEFSFIQIGAHDGQSNDPLRRLITTLRWTGVLVEPQPELFRQLVESYSGWQGLHFENAAIADVDGTKKLYRIRPDAVGVPEWASQLASFDLKTLLHHEKWIPNIGKLLEEIPVPCVTIKTLAARYGLHDVDLLQIDAEGYDAEIIRTIPLSTIRPRFISFEHRHLHRADFDSCCATLVRHGYRLAVGNVDTYAARIADDLAVSDKRESEIRDRRLTASDRSGILHD
jgi:FkbM family methyltransferase